MRLVDKSTSYEGCCWNAAACAQHVWCNFADGLSTRWVGARVAVDSGVSNVLPPPLLRKHRLVQAWGPPSFLVLAQGGGGGVEFLFSQDELNELLVAPSAAMHAQPAYQTHMTGIHGTAPPAGAWGQVRRRPGWS